ncbi:F-box protein [archaeon]|nr:MAG: F-box protein [archaeon]
MIEDSEVEEIVFGLNPNSSTSECLDVLPYGYSILDYARKYDEAFKSLVRHLCRTFFPRKVDSLKTCKPNYFPAETVFEIFTYLDHTTLLQAACVSKLWFFLSEKCALWDRLLLHTFSLSLRSINYVTVNSQSKKRNLSDPCDLDDIFGKEPPSRAMFKKMTRSFRSLINNEHLMGII